MTFFIVSMFAQMFLYSYTDLRCPYRLCPHFYSFKNNSYFLKYFFVFVFIYCTYEYHMPIVHAYNPKYKYCYELLEKNNRLYLYF